MSMPVYNPPVPFSGPIGGHLLPGRMVRIQGTVPHSADRFVVNLTCGPYEGDDIALHLSVRFPQAKVVRNTQLNKCWGPEETFGPMPFTRGMGFELLMLCDPEQYKIAVNGQHFVEYIHRTPYDRVTHLGIHQDVILAMIQWEGGPANGMGAPAGPGFVLPAEPIAPPLGPSAPAPPYPPYGAPPGCSPLPPPGHPPPPPHGYPPPPPGYPPPPPGYPPPPPGYQKKALKAQKKARKKALKYGLPIAGIAGLGLGAYAAHKTLHSFHHSSSSSSSSSSEEE